jgi:competence protein ComEA
MQFKRSKAGLIPVLVVATLLMCGCKSNDYQVIQSKDSSIESSTKDSVESGSLNEASISKNSIADASATDDSVAGAFADGNSTDNSNYDGSISDVIIKVYVCGAVNNSGVYELSSGDRIADAIDAAGGFSTEAATEYLNLAMVVSDGMKIQVPTTDEIEELEKVEAQSSSDNQADGSADTSFVVTGDGKPVDTNKQNSEADNTSALSSCDNASDSSNVLVNINTAGVDELCTLSGIGKSRADAIIAYRNENGPFKSIEDIKKVSGIKDKVFEQIKDSITV